MKLQLTVVALVVCIFCGMAVQSRLRHRVVSRDTRTEQNLDYATDKNMQLYFEGINDEYFEGKLPRTTVHFVPNLRDDTGERDDAEVLNGSPYRMLLDTDFQKHPKSAEELVFHESCHLWIDLHGGEFDSHGQKWQNCMRYRGADAGAFNLIW